MALANAVSLKVGYESNLKSLAIGDLAVKEGNIEKGLGIYQSILETVLMKAESKSQSVLFIQVDFLRISSLERMIQEY